MKWPMPKLIKVYEALGAIGDKRVEVLGDQGKVYSSSLGKHYTVDYDPDTNEIYANDNASFFAGYLGYPAISYLLATKRLDYNLYAATALAGIAWKDINQKYKNDFVKTLSEVEGILVSKGIDPRLVEVEAESILKQLAELQLVKPAKRAKPPKGY